MTMTNRRGDTDQPTATPLQAFANELSSQLRSGGTTIFESEGRAWRGGIESSMLPASTTTDGLRTESKKTEHSMAHVTILFSTVY